MQCPVKYLAGFMKTVKKDERAAAVGFLWLSILAATSVWLLYILKYG